MCRRRLPFDEALAIADSALRHGDCPPDTLREAARVAKGRARPGSGVSPAGGRRRAANPFESVLRAIALDVPGLHVEPQVRIPGELGLDVRPDLVDVSAALVLEADSFEWHGDRAALSQ